MENHLDMLDEFESALLDYKISNESKIELAKTNLLLMLAPSASGRNTIIKELLKTDDYYFIVSDTTRKPRINDGVLEQNGIEYWFRTERQMLKDLQDGNLLEAEIIHGQHVSGVSIRELKKANQLNKTAITDIDLGGARIVSQAKPDTKVILLIPPSFDEWMKRLNGRGNISTAEIKRRIQTAEKILHSAADHVATHVVVNDDIKDSVKKIHDITNDKYKISADATELKILENLYTKTREWLNSH